MAGWEETAAHLSAKLVAVEQLRAPDLREGRRKPHGAGLVRN